MSRRTDGIGYALAVAVALAVAAGRLVHGTGDDNVHYQGTEALINALVASNKQFSMMSYPNRSHGIYEGPGTTRHLFGLLTRYLMDKLPAGAAMTSSSAAAVR